MMRNMIDTELVGGVLSSCGFIFSLWIYPHTCLIAVDL